MFISYREMAETFIEAEAEGYIMDLEDNAECDSNCDSCPAKDSCDTLLEGETYQTWVDNYTTWVLPIIMEIKQND